MLASGNPYGLVTRKNPPFPAGSRDAVDSPAFGEVETEGHRNGLVQIQKAQEASWADYEKVAQTVAVDDNPPEGLIVHAAGRER